MQFLFRITELASYFSLTVSLPKTKGLAVASALSEVDVSPVPVDGGEIEMLQEFMYLGSKLSCDEDITSEVSCHIARASKTLWLFENTSLSKSYPLY